MNDMKTLISIYNSFQDEAKTLEDGDEITFGLNDADGRVNEVFGLVGDRVPDGFPSPHYSNSDEKFVWFLDEIVSVETDYDDVVSLVDKVNSKPDSVLNGLFLLDDIVKESTEDFYSLDDLLQKTDPVRADKVNEGILETEIRIASSSKGAKDLYGWKNKKSSVGQLIELLSIHREGSKDGLAILQGSIVGKQRKATAVDQLELLILDIDTGDSMTVIEDRIRELGWFCVMYTTHSHMKPSTDIKSDTLVKFADSDRITVNDAIAYLREEKRYNPEILENAKLEGPTHKADGIVYTVNHKPMPKFRLVFLLQEPFVIAERSGTQKDAIEEWKERYAGVAEVLKANYDRSCVDPSRLMYTPRHPKGASVYGVTVIDGDSLPLDEISRISMKGRKSAQNAFTAEAGSDGDDELENPWLRRFVAKYGNRFEAADFCSSLFEVREEKGDKIITECPNDDAHSDAGNSEDKGFFCVNSSMSDGGFAMKCMHDSCATLDRLAMLDRAVSEFELEQEDLVEFVLQTEEDEELEEKVKDTVKEGIIDYPTCETYVDENVMNSKELSKVIDWLKAVKPKDHDEIAEEVILGNLAKKAKVAKKLLSDRIKKYRSNNDAWDDHENEENEEENSGSRRKYQKRMSAINKEFALVKLGKQYSVIEVPDESRKDSITSMDVNSYNMESFRTKFMNETIQMMKDGQVRNVRVGDAWLEFADRRTYDGGIIFEPTPEKVPHNALNLWSGFPKKGKKGAWPLIQKHLFEVFCLESEENYDYMMSWLAHMIQHPGEKPGSAIVMRGKKGVGKSLFFETLVKNVIGFKMHMVTSKPEQVFGKFNSHLFTKLFLLMDEGVWGGEKRQEGALKTLVTQEVMSFEPKGEAVFNAPNYTRYVIISNEQWVVPASSDERRFFAIDASEKYRGNSEYFSAFAKEINDPKAIRAFLYELETYPINREILYKPPLTEVLQEQIDRSNSKIVDFFKELLYDGKIFENEREDLPEIEFNLDEETYVPKKLILDHFLTYCKTTERHVKTMDFFLTFREIFGNDPRESRIRRRNPVGGGFIELIKFPPLRKYMKYSEEDIITIE